MELKKLKSRELDKMYVVIYTIKTPVQLGYALRNEKGERLMEDDVKEAKEASISDDVVGLYDKELHEELLRNTELYNAEQKGKDTGIRETAKKMIKDNLDINTIIKYTGLTKEEINSLNK